MWAGGERKGGALTVSCSIWCSCMLAQFFRDLEEQLKQKEWEKLKALPQARVPAPGGPSSRMRAGIMGIERDLREKQSRANAQVSEAFRDLDALIGKVRGESFPWQPCDCGEWWSSLLRHGSWWTC